MVRYFSPDTRTCLLECWSDRIPFFVRKCQIDDDDPINGEHERLEGRWHKGVTGAHHEWVGAERHTQQDSANRRPHAGKHKLLFGLFSQTLPNSVAANEMLNNEA